MGQHNEDRIFISNIVAVILGRTTHFNLFVEMYLGAALLFLAIGLIILAHKRRAPDTPLLFYCPVAILLVSLVQYGDTLWGFQSPGISSLPPSCVALPFGSPAPLGLAFVRGNTWPPWSAAFLSFKVYSSGRPVSS